MEPLRGMVTWLGDSARDHYLTIKALGLGLIGAFIGVTLAATMLLGLIERRLDFLSFEAARYGTALYLSNAYEVSGPGGLGRVLIIPNDARSALSATDCPSWAEPDAVCLYMRPLRGD